MKLTLIWMEWSVKKTAECDQEYIQESFHHAIGILYNFWKLTRWCRHSKWGSESQNDQQLFEISCSEQSFTMISTRWSHCSRETRALLRNIFGEDFKSRFAAFNWLSRIPDLTAPDFSLGIPQRASLQQQDSNLWRTIFGWKLMVCSQFLGKWWKMVWKGPNFVRLPIMTI